MGKKLNLYYEQLKNLMSGQPPKTLDEAKQALQAQQQEKAPLDGEARERFDYAQKCNNAIMDLAAQKIQKEAPGKRRASVMLRQREIRSFKFPRAPVTGW